MNGKTCILNQRWKIDECQGGCKITMIQHACREDYAWNPSVCACQCNQIKTENSEMPYSETVSFEEIHIQKYKFHLGKKLIYVSNVSIKHMLLSSKYFRKKEKISNTLLVAKTMMMI